MHKLFLSKIARYIELENFCNRVFIIVMLFETNGFFGSSDELNIANRRLEKSNERK